MEKNTRKEVLIELVASVAGLILSLYSLVTLKDAGGFRLFLAVVGVGIFLLGSIRYGIRWRKLRKQQEA